MSSSKFYFYLHKYVYFIVIVQNRLGRLTPFKHHLNGLNAKRRVTDYLLHPTVLHHITVSCTLMSRIIKLQKTDTSIFHIKRKMKEQELKHFRVDENGGLWFKDRLLVPKD
jgi:hypothetical protein